MRPQGWETSVKLGGVEQALEGRSPMPMKSGRGRRSSPWTWRWGDRLVLLCAWTAGLGLCAIAAAIVIYMGYRGIEYLTPEPFGHASRGRYLAGPDGGHPRSPDRHAAADGDRDCARLPTGRRERDLGGRVPPGRAGAAGIREGRRVEHRDRRGDAGHRARAVRRWRSSSSASSHRCRSAPKAAGCTAARSSPPGR